MPHTTTTVMALDTFWPVGRALSRVIGRSPMIDWCGLAIDTASWREMLIAANPHVALIDGIGFLESPAELLRLTRSVAPQTRTIAFVPTLADVQCRPWYDAGAAACIAKWMEPDLIVDVIVEVRRGTFDRKIIRELLSPSTASA